MVLYVLRIRIVLYQIFFFFCNCHFFIGSTPINALTSAFVRQWILLRPAKSEAVIASSKS